MTDAPWDIMRSLLGLDAEELDAGQMALRGLLTFIVTIAIVRLGDKRVFGKGTAFDIIVAIMIGSVMSRAITGSSPLFATWVAGAVLVGLHWLLAALAYRIPWFGPLVKGHPVLLVDNGNLQRDAMRGSGITRMDLDQALRTQGMDASLSDVDRAWLERDGSISIVPTEKEPHMLDIAVQDGVQTVRISVQ
jgi:uncharacterized membrane protein YcaP (DUF421 family)